VADEHGEIQRAREQRDHRILELHAAGCSQRAIAEKVGCALGLVNSVIKRFC
jgi:transposase